MKYFIRSAAAALAAIFVLTAFSSCDIFRMKYPGEDKYGTYREETVDFIIITDKESLEESKGVITKENGETLEFRIGWTSKSHFDAYTVNKADCLFSGNYYASGKLYGTGTFTMEILTWSVDPLFEKTELVFELQE